MTYLKLLTVLTTLALLTACGGAAAPADKTGGDTKTSGDTNTGGNNNGGGGGNPTDCTQTPFHNDCLTDTPAIALRETMCLANIQIDDSCRGEDGIATVFCKADPFNTATACVADTYLPDRVEDCITDGNAGIARCNTLFTASASNNCLTNPFTDACTSNTDFGTYATTARTNRKSFCASDSTGSSLCTALKTCQTNPLGATCGAYFEPERIIHCASNPDIASCPNVTSGDWLDSFTALATAPVSTDTTNPFLSGLTDTPPVVEGFDAGSVSDFGSSLTLADNGLGGDATDGASFFWGNFRLSEGAFNTRYYAGIHASTDLGAPLNNVSQAGIWIGWILLDGSFAINRKFDLNVTFGTTSNGNAGTIDAFTTNGGSFRLKIDGEFNDNGVIIMGTTLSGTTSDEVTIVDNQWRTPGTLTGLIGQEGVVAAFVSTTNTNNNDDTLGAQPYIGAFAARPRTPDPEPLVVNYGDWVRDSLPSLSATPDVAPEAPTHKSQFLAGTTTLDPLTSITPTLLTNTIGGVGFFTENSQYYAGLLSNTSLGTPVAITPQANSADVMAEWEGEIRAIGVFNGNAGSGDTTTALDLDVAVNLTARTFTGTVVDPNASTTSITINGLFPATDRGVVTGTVTQRHGTFQYGGLLTGLIGQDGVVGAFYSNANQDVSRRYVGGFYAAPQ